MSPPISEVTISYEAVLGQMVTIREGGTARRVTAAEAFLLQLTKSRGSLALSIELDWLTSQLGQWNRTNLTQPG